MAVINKNGTYMALPSAIKRGSAIALDTTAVWYSREEMENYAATSVVAYVGQILSLVDETNNTATAYMIIDTAGTLQEVGSATLGDNVSIELKDGVLAVKDFGKRFYKYIAAVEGGEAAHYELVEVDENNPWEAGLEPRVVSENGTMVIGWYQPNPTTVDGVQDQVIAVQDDVAEAKEEINVLDELLNGTAENPGGLVGEVEDIADVLYGTEGENPVPGLVDTVEALETNLADNYYTKSETYSKTEVDGLVSGVFHFEGSAESYEALPTEGNNNGDVYQVGDKEYAWNGTTWVELGYVVDLSGYYTKSETDAAVKKVQDDLDAAEEDIAELVAADLTINSRIDGLETEHTTINGAIDAVEEDITELVAEDERLAGLINSHETRIETLETAKIGFDTHFETVDGQIEALQNADTAFETRIGTLEGYVGTPTGDLGALYPAVESLNKRLNDIVAEGGEPNQINGVSINGTALVPNDALIVDLPIFTGSASGLVPVVNGLGENYFLNAVGDWAIPVDARIGNLTLNEVQYTSVEEYVAAAIDAADKMYWGTII